MQRASARYAGVTVLIYDQTCAAEKRRRRKKGEFPDPDKRLFINEAVCEGCGDCGVQSNCLSVEPVETELGRKRRIDQSSCNKDYSCVNGFCPSFVTLEGAQAEESRGRRVRSAKRSRGASMRCRCPRTHLDDAPYDILITGVGGTGVVTVGALISMAAHLEGKSASVLDFMGFAQKGGSVLSFVRFAATDALLNQVRIDTQQADVLLACDMVVGASADALQTVRHGRTRIVVNTHAIPNATLRAEPGREPSRRRAARQDASRGRRRADVDLRRAGARDAFSRRHDRREHPDARLRVAARSRAGVARAR